MTTTMLDPRPPEHMAWIDVISKLPDDERADFIQALNIDEQALVDNAWPLIARREQLPPPGDWSVWINLAGRGAGKTRSGSEWIIENHRSGRMTNTALIGATVGDVRKYMIDGNSGIVKTAPDDFKPIHNPSLRKVVWPNGTESHTYSAEDPERLRGPNHDGAWADELAAWQYLEETWDMLEYTLRVSENPRVYVSTTPKPRLVLRRLIEEADTVLTRGSTFDNWKNLSPKFQRRMREKFVGTRLGRQELYAELLDEAEGALFERDLIDKARITEAQCPEIVRSVVSIDPAATDTELASETGIIVSGIDEQPIPHGYVLEDLSGRYSPEQWARKAILAYEGHEANGIIAERNNGGDMVKYTIETTAKTMFSNQEIRSPNVPVRVVFASKGKFARAEPISAMAEQGRIHHVGNFSALEDQQCTWEPDSKFRSPDRLDAFVWGFTDLMLIAIDGVTMPPLSFETENYWQQAG